MLKSILTTSFRNLIRNRSFSIINMVGLSVSMSLALLIILVIKEQYGFDKFHKDADRIYRVMIAQRMLHGEKAQVKDEQGKTAVHTPELVSRIFNEELDRILRELPAGSDKTVGEKYREARKIGERMIVQGEFDPV